MNTINKKKCFRRFIVTAVSLSLLNGTMLYGKDSAIEHSTIQKSVTVFAAAGTMTAMQRIADEYESQTGDNVILNFASSSTLARQIGAGANFDVFISANSRWMNEVQDKNFIESSSRCVLLTDRLALIAPVDSDVSIANATIGEVLTSTSGSIAIGDASYVPCGMYAKEALTNLNCWDSIQDRIVPAASVRTAQQYIESRQCELGVVYHAAATQSDKVKVITVFDETLHLPIQFSAACSTESKIGNTFLGFLNQSVAMKIFSASGFESCIPDALPTAQTISVEPTFEVNTWQTLLISLKVAAACTLVVAAPGVLLGYTLARKSFPGRSIVNAFVLLPMVIPPVVAGYLALILLGKNSFLGHWLYDVFGISIAFSWMGAVVVSAVMGLPLLIRSVKTTVEMIDHRYALAANTLGASPLRTFFTVTIPLAGPGILAGLVLAFARCLGEFGATALFAGNIPGKTQTLSLAIFNFTQIPGAESTVLRFVGISIVLSFGAMLGSEFLNQRMKHLGGTT